MKIDGSCHCGKITYEAELDPDQVIICHCSDCQILSGSAFRTVGFLSSEDFKMSGEPKIYIKIADSGRKRAMAFCPDCGTPIYASDPGDGPRMLGLRMGTVHQRDRLPPKSEKWCESALPWALGASKGVAET